MSNANLYVVTGAGSGIGQAIAREIVGRGHHVFGVGRTARKLQSTQVEIGDKFSFTTADLSTAPGRLDAIQNILEALRSQKRKLGGLVNNAGVIERVSFAESGDDVWERHFNANLYSAVGLTRGLHGELKDNPGSSVLNISSTLGLRPIALTTAYSASKAAMVNWTRGLALEWAADGIRVNCVCPGLVDTPIHSTPPPDHVQPLGRVGRSDDIAKAAWFLLSPDSSWTTGAVLSVDGGISL